MHFWDHRAFYVRVYVRPLFQLSNQFTDFHKTEYKTD